MRRLLNVVMLLLLGVLPATSVAQETGNDWPPDPAEIFAPGVEIVEMPSHPIGVTHTPIPPIAWVYVSDESGDRTRLRNSETAQFSDPLPEKINWSEVFVSPSDEWLVLVGRDTELSSLRHFSYEISNGTIIDLGFINNGMDRSVRIIRWITDTLAFYSARSDYSGYFFTFDVTQANSLKPVITTDSNYRSQPPRYEFLENHFIFTQKWDTNGHHQPCKLSIFDFNTVTDETYTLGYDCGGVYAPDDFHYFYLAYEDDPLKLASVYRLDIRTGEQTLIRQGEFEELRSVSPDMRYLVLITDNNGKIDRLEADLNFFSSSQLGNPQVTFLDLLTQEVVYEIPFGIDDTDLGYLGVGTTEDDNYSLFPDVTWMSNRVFIMQSSPGSKDNVLVELEDGNINQRLLGELYTILPDKQHLIMWTDGRDVSIGLHIYDWRTEQKIPIINPLSVTQYQIRYTARADDIIYIYLTNGTEDAEYGIRLPAFEP